MRFLKRQYALCGQFFRERLLRRALWCLAAFVAAGLLAGLLCPREQAAALQERFAEALQQEELMDAQGGIRMPELFLHNVRTVASSMLAGLVPFLFLPAAILLLNGGLLGVVLTLYGKSAWKVLLLGILPHGIFEIPAIMLGCAMGLLLCRSVMDSLRRKPDAQPLEKLFPALFRVFCAIACRCCWRPRPLRAGSRRFVWAFWGLSAGALALASEQDQTEMRND